MVSEVESRLTTHEAVCAERYAGINARLKRLEHILIGSAGNVISIGSAADTISMGSASDTISGV